MSQTTITLAFEQWKAQQGTTGEPVLLDEFVFANVPALDPDQPVDRNETLPPAEQIVHRQAVSRKGVVNDNAVVHSVVLGADVGDFSFNWIGLINKASGTLAMIVHAPLQQKLKTAEGKQGNVLTRSFLMEYNGAQAETGINTPAETWQIDFTARMAGMDERQRQENIDIYGAAAFFGDGWLVGKNGDQYFVTKGAGYVAGLRAELAANQNITVTAKPVMVWLDVCWTGTLTSVWSVQSKVTVADSLSDHVHNGVKHYVFALASISADGKITDLRPKESVAEQVASDAMKKHEQSRNHPDATTNEKGFTQLSNDTDSDSEERAATSKAVKMAMDNANSRLSKEKNGADIEDVTEFVNNIGLGNVHPTLLASRLNGALVSRGRKALNPVRIFFGADSLSEGTPDSYTQIVGGMMGAKTAQSGLLVPCRKSLVSNVSGFLEGRDAGTRGVYPRTYSLSGDALYGDELVNATMRHLPMVTSGVQMAWKKARLYYLAQPDGGTFEFRQYSASGTKGDIVSVNTRNDSYQIKYAEIMVNPDVSQAYTEVLNGNGKLCLFLLEYINSDSDFISFNGGQGGSSAQDWNRLNKETQRQWMNHLRFDTYIYNAGTNDRYSRTENDLKEDLTGHLRNIASADNAPHIIVVVPTQTKDYGNTHAKDYPPVYSAVAEDNGFGFISMPLCLGDYATCSKRFGMLADGIHPSRAAHRAFGFFFASLLNMSVKNEPRPAFSAGGGSSDADPYEVDFSKWRSNGALVKGGVRTLIATFQPGAPYIHVYLDIEVAARVNPGVFSFIERRMRIHMRSGGSSGNITQAQVLLNEEKTRLIESGWGFTFSTEADTSTGMLQIFMEVSRDCNIFSRVTDVRVLVGSVAAKGSALKMVSML